MSCRAGFNLLLWLYHTHLPIAGRLTALSPAAEALPAKHKSFHVTTAFLQPSRCRGVALA